MDRAKQLNDNWASMSHIMKLQHISRLQEVTEPIHSLWWFMIYKYDDHYEVLDGVEIIFFMTEESAINYCLDNVKSNLP